MLKIPPEMMNLSPDGHTKIPNEIFENEFMGADEILLSLYLLMMKKEEVGLPEVRHWLTVGYSKGYQIIRQMEKAGYLEKIESRYSGQFGPVKYRVTLPVFQEAM